MSGPIRVETGLTDGTMTEVRGDEVKEGLVVILSRQVHKTDEETVSPFTPQAFRKRRSGGQ